jgi:transcriptional regulator GlxA family with amidase domain
MKRTVGIFLFKEMEVLDFAGPFEVFHSASRVKVKIDQTASHPFEVVTIAESKDPVTARGGLLVTPQFTIDDHPPLHVLIIPGGMVKEEMHNSRVIQWIKNESKTTEITASVCTGAFLLAQAELLHNKSATTHWDDIDDLQTMFPSIQVQRDVRWVDGGRVITSAGISAGISMSLHLVSRLEGRELALQTARRMEFDW